MECIQSIKANVVLPGLVLIVNDFSDDSDTYMAYEMVRSMEGVNLKIIQSEYHTIGGGHPMNIGLDYIVKHGYKLGRYMGSDDALMPDCLYVHKHIFDNLDTMLEQADDLDTIQDKTFGGVQTFHVMYYETKKRYSDQNSASHPVFIVEKFLEAGMRFEENKARNVDGPVLANFYSKYFCLTTTNYRGEVYRIHKDNMSHDANGVWYGDIPPDTQNDFRCTPYALRKKRLTRMR